MAVTSVSGGNTNSIGNGTGADASKGASEKVVRNGHDKENNSANGTTTKPGSDGDTPASTNTIEIGANLNVSQLV